MSILCHKCRRLERGNNMFINNAEYYCPKCKVHYKLSKSYIDDYFHRYESPIDSEIINELRTAFMDVDYILSYGDYSFESLMIRKGVEI